MNPASDMIKEKADRVAAEEAVGEEISDKKKTDSVVTADQKSKPDVSATTKNNYYIPLTKIALPDAVARPFVAIDQKMQAARRYALRVTPAWLVNMNSNVNGILHVAAEIVMFKASGVKYMNPREGKEANVFIDPARNLYRAMTGADKDKALQNHWSSRSTMGGFAAWTLGTIVPDKVNNQEEVDKAEELSKEAPIKYAAKRLFESVQIGNPHTKRQQIALGVTVAGIFSTIAGFRNVNIKTGARFFNWSHALGGAITALAGSQLLFSLSDKQGWQHFGNTVNLRIPLLLLSIHKKWQNHDRWAAYALGQALFQGAAIYSYLYGGAQKLPDGTIIEASTKKTEHSNDAKDLPQLTDTEQADVAERETARHSLMTADAPSTKSLQIIDHHRAIPLNNVVQTALI